MMHKANKGFIAVIAVVLLASGTLAFALSVMSGSAWYADSVMHREMRIQKKLNEEACIETVGLMLQRDIFLKGTITVRDLNCTADVENDYKGEILIRILSRSDTIHLLFVNSLTDMS